MRQVPLTRRVLAILVKPDLDVVVGLATVDIEEHAAVGNWGDPISSLGPLVFPHEDDAMLFVPVLATAVSQRNDLSVFR